MNQKVRNPEDGILRLLTDIDGNKAAVLFGNDPVQGQGQSHPLILLDAAVIMRVQKSQVAVLIEGILL